MPDIRNYGAGDLVIDNQAVTWADSAGADTTDTVTLPTVKAKVADALYAITVLNPSDDTALTVIVQGTESMGNPASDVHPEVTRFSVAAAADGSTPAVEQAQVRIGLENGGRIVLSNDTALDAGEGFTAYVTVRKLGP